jgi:hypothetical protein
VVFVNHDQLLIVNVQVLGGVTSIVYVLFVSVLALPAASHTIALNIVVTVNVGVFHTVELHVGGVLSVVYLIVVSALVHVGAILLQKY